MNVLSIESKIVFLFIDCNVFTVANGTKSTNDIGHGTRVTVICSEGYSLSGPPIVTCSHGVWLDNIPTCHKGNSIVFSMV